MEDLSDASGQQPEALATLGGAPAPHVSDGEEPASQPAHPAQPARPAVHKSAPASSGGLPAWALLLLGGAAAGVALLLRHLHQKRSGKAQPVRVSRAQVFAVSLPAPPAPASPAGVPPPMRPLAGRVLVVSDRVDVQGVPTRFGSDPWRSGQPPSAASHEALQALVAAGMEAQAVVPSECLGLGPLLSGAAEALPNPAGKGRSHGGGDYGAAVAVAAGHADLALGVDELGSARVPAACCGVYCYRPTAGVLPLEGVSVASPSLAAPALLASDPSVLLRAGEALQLPGGSSRGDVATYLVAEDYLSRCSPSMQSMVPAVIAAVKRWAGPDQAQGLSLAEWLHHRMQRLREFAHSKGEEGAEEERGAAGPNGSGREGQQRHTQSVLHALAVAAETVRQWEFEQQHGEWVQQQQAEAGSHPPEAGRFQQQAQQVSEERYCAAQAVMAELAANIRGALQEGYVFVLPTTPGEAPRSGGDGEEERGAFREQCLQFAALAALAGVPQVTVPLPVPGRLPLSISLLALHKKDLSLLQAAAKLGPLLAEEAARLAAEQAQQGKQQPGGGGRGAAAAGGGRRRGSSRGGEAEEEARARAEACKAAGNEAYKARRYEEAARQYSAAVQLDPRNPTYYSNRAMAYLKLGLYGPAEADCDDCLKLDATNVKALLRRGSARMAQGEAEGAKADFKQALALEPQNRQAREELAAITRLEGQLEL